MRKQSPLYALILTALLLSLGYLLPFVTGQMQTLGKLLSPMHLPVFICGLCCGPVWGLILGAVLPVTRSLMLGMPPLVPVAIPMAFELACYGLVCGLAYPLLVRLMKQKGHLIPLLLSLVLAMLLGRLVGGAAKAVVMGLSGSSYTLQAFIAGYFTETALGALVHLLIVPPIVLALEKARLCPIWQQ